MVLGGWRVLSDVTQSFGPKLWRAKRSKQRGEETKREGERVRERERERQRDREIERELEREREEGGLTSPQAAMLKLWLPITIHATSSPDWYWVQVFRTQFKVVTQMTFARYVNSFTKVLLRGL